MQSPEDSSDPLPVPDAAPSGEAAPPPGASPLNRLQRRERAVADALRTLVRDLYTARFGAHPPRVEQMELALRVRIRPLEDWALTFDPPLGAQCEEQLQDYEAAGGVYSRGRVFCFRCKSGDCEHGIPPSATRVFRGYSATGLPEWCELAQAFVEARDPRADQLFATPPVLLAGVRLGGELKSRQLSSFGRASRTYAILGQVVAGFFLRPVEGGGRERVAVTLQAVESRDAAGRFQLKFNPVCAGMEAADWNEHLSGTWGESLGRCLYRAEEVLTSMEQDVRAARESGAADQGRQRMRRLPGVLGTLARAIEQAGRQGARRTRHVEQRRGQRPVGKALDDAVDAGDDALFFDERRGTFVACGRQGRAHVFNADARHVTSFVLPAGGAEFRVRTGRWRPLLPEEAADLRARLAGAIRGGAGE